MNQAMCKLRGSAAIDHDDHRDQDKSDQGDRFLVDRRGEGYQDDHQIPEHQERDDQSGRQNSGSEASHLRSLPIRKDVKPAPTRN